MAKVLERLQAASEMAPNHQCAVASETGTLSYRALAKNVSTLSHWFASLNAQVVALHIENCIDWVVIDLACQEASIICVPLPAFFSSAQIRSCLAQTGVDLLISDQSTAGELVTDGLVTGGLVTGELVTGELVNEFLQINQSSVLPSSLFVWQAQDISPANEPAYLDTLLAKGTQLPKSTQKITFTSGSTGSPKGVCLSFDHQWQVAQSLADAIAIKQPKHLCLLPLSTLLENVAGIYAPLLCGGTVIVASDNSRGLSGSSGLDTPAFLSFIDSTQPDTLILLPQLLLALVAACQQGWKTPCSLKFVAVGGARVAPDLIAQARSYQIPVYQGYGLSECGSVVALNTKAHDHADSVGYVLPHCHLSTQDDEIVVSGACHLGYLGDDSSWYPNQIKTGDLGSVYKGFVSIKGRRKNTLITSYGRNVSPEWIESELMSTPLLSQCMVIGDDQPFLSALISAPDNVSNDALNHWLQQVNQRLPDYGQLKQWRRIQQPRWQTLMTANGRLLREAVSEAFKKEIEDIYADQELACTPEKPQGIDQENNGFL